MFLLHSTHGTAAIARKTRRFESGPQAWLEADGGTFPLLLLSFLLTGKPFSLL